MGEWKGGFILLPCISFSLFLYMLDFLSFFLCISIRDGCEFVCLYGRACF